MKRMSTVALAACLLSFGGAMGVQAQEHHRGKGGDEHAEHARGHQVSKQDQKRQKELAKLSEKQQKEQEQRMRAQEAARTRELHEQQKYQARQQQARVKLSREQEQARERALRANEAYNRAAYRYRVGAASRVTNRSGAELLKRAVSDGYRQGYELGRVDRGNHDQFDYRDSRAFRDATFGYTGSYLDRADYQYYYRQGLQRGYDDGYYQQHQYGLVGSSGTALILGSVLAAILGFTLH